MKLFKVPSNTWVILQEVPKRPPGAPMIWRRERILFHKIDGSYSLCEKEDGTRCQMGSTTEVAISEDQ